MGKQELDNLVKVNSLYAEPATRQEFDGMVASARRSIGDAQVPGLTVDGRFTLTYRAAHSLALAALRRHGYRSKNRYIVFQTLEHTLGTDKADIRVFDKAHNERNQTEYGGAIDIDEALLDDLLHCTQRLLARVEALDPPP